MARLKDLKNGDVVFAPDIEMSEGRARRIAVPVFIVEIDSLLELVRVREKLSGKESLVTFGIFKRRFRDEPDELFDWGAANS